MTDDNTYSTTAWMPRWHPHRLANVTLLPRSFAYFHTCGFSVWIALESGAGWSLILPALFLVIWPIVAYCHSGLAKDSKRAEFQNLHIDCVLLGGWSAMLGYYLWTTLALGLGCMMNNLITGGTRHLISAVILFTLGLVGVGFFTEYQLRSDVGPGPEIYQACGYLIYFLAIGYAMYGQNRKIGRNIQEIQFKNRVFQSLLDISSVADDSPDINALLENALQHLCSNFPEYGVAVSLYQHQRPAIIRYSAIAGLQIKDEQRLLNLLTDTEQPRESVIHLETNQEGEKFYAASMAGRLSLYEGWLIVRAPRRAHDALKDMLVLLIDELAAATENKLLHLELRKAAERDGLTGLYNRGFFESSLEESIQHKLQRPDCDFAILMVDVDGLKQINDQYGHIAGDQLIINAAEHLRQHCRQGDILARYGGDEFVLLCPTSGIDETNLITERVRRHLDETLFTIGTIDNQPIAVTLCLSIGSASSENAPPSEVLRVADQRMYADKAQRRESRNSQTHTSRWN